MKKAIIYLVVICLFSSWGDNKNKKPISVINKDSLNLIAHKKDSLNNIIKEKDSLIIIEKTDSLSLLITNFGEGKLKIFAKVNNEGKGILYATYYKNNKLISKISTKITLTSDSLEEGIIFNKSNKLLYNKYCQPFDTILFFCIGSTIYLNGFDLYGINLINDKISFYKLIGDKLGILTTEGYWIIQKNKKYFLKVNPYRGGREKNVTMYEIKENTIIQKKIFKVQLLYKDNIKNNKAIEVFNKLIKN